VSDEGNTASDAALDGDDTVRDNGGRTAVVTDPVTRPLRPTGKRSRRPVADSSDSADSSAEASLDERDEAEDAGASESGDAGRALSKAGKTPKAKKAKPAKTDRSANPLVFVYNYLKQVVAEMRKVIWPNRKQMATYTSVVLIFLTIMVAVVGLADLGLAKLILLVFG